MNDKIQEEKAVLCKKIGDLAMKVPYSVCNGSIETVRKWKEERLRAYKVIKNKKSSVSDLQAVLNMMRAYE